MSDLASPEIIFGVLIGAGGSVWLVKFSDLAHRIGLAGDYLQLAAALLGIVFAGFALVIGLLSDSYIRWLQQTSNGLLGFLRPFMISIGMQVGCLIGSVAYRAVAAKLDDPIENWFFGAISTLFVLSALDIVALARTVLMHGVARANGLEISDLEEKRSRKRNSS